MFPFTSNAARQVFSLAVLLSCATLTFGQAEWPQYLGGPGHAGFSHERSIRPPLKLYWSFRLDGDASGDAGAGLTVGGGLVYLNVLNSRSIVALDAHTGAFRWEYSDSYPGYKDVPSYADGRLFLWERSKKPRVLALEAATGKLLWEHPLRDAKFFATYIRTGLAIDRGAVFLSEGGDEPVVEALDAKTGKSQWQVRLKDVGSYITTPSVANGRVFIGLRSSLDEASSKRGALIALDARTGNEVWRRASIPGARPLATDGVDIACTIAQEGKLSFHLLDAGNGATRWSVPRSGAQSPGAMLAPDVILLKTSNGAFAVLDRKTGKNRHSFLGRTRSGCCVPAVAGEYVFWGTGTTPPPSGGAADVESLSAFAWPESPREKGIIGNMHVIDLKTGKSVWRFGTGNTICGDPALAYGRLYFTSRDGKVYCFAPAAKDEPATPEAKETSPKVAPEVVAKLLKREDTMPEDSWPMAGCQATRIGGVTRPLEFPLQQKWKFRLKGRIVCEAVARDGIAYLGSESGAFAALDVKTGARQWEYAFPGPVRCSAAVAGDLVYCGSDAGTMLALDVRTGKERWRFACGGPIQSAPAIVGGVLLFGADDHHVYALERDTGRKLWSFRMPAHSIRAPVVVHGQQVFVGQWNDWVSALDLLTGEEQWRSLVPVSIEALAFHKEKLYARSPYYIIELDPKSGRRLRMAQTSYGYGGMAFLGDSIIQSGIKGQYGESGATRIDLSAAGRELKNPTLEQVTMLPATRFPNLVELASLTTPLVLGDQMCFATCTGTLALTDAGGKRLWDTSLAGRCHSSPIAASGILILGCDDGHVHAFGK